MKNDSQKTLNKNFRRYLYRPLILVESYIIFTIILYVFGPWEWQTENPISFYMLLFGYNLAFILGYFLSANKKRKSNPNYIFSQQTQLKFKSLILNYLKIAIYIYLIFTILNCIRVTGLQYLNPVAYFNEVLNGLKNPALQYHEKFTYNSGNLYGGSVLSYINVLISPLIYPVVPLSIFYFKDLKIMQKTVVFFSILLEVSRWIAIGTNKGIFDIAIIIVTVLLIKNIISRLHSRVKIKRNFTKFKTLALIIFPLYFFVNAISDRLGGSKVIYSRYINNTGINPDSLLMIITPDYLKTALILLSSYLTQGYYALSLATNIPFTPMFGIGNSMFLIDNFQGIFKENFFEHTFQEKLTVYGWDPFVQWHTFYLWIANDVSLFGVIFVMFFIGYVYATIWKDVLLYSNPIAIVLMSLYSIMFAYISANNQVLTYPTTFLAFWGLTFYWVITRKRYRMKGQ
ncbi:hypothetical protein ACSVDE_14625 [Pseudalkalibacillus sp. Hm43]|uniref:hypothetical protein n=1 Tax=Pseudalkalibacillus sp. Hm43 TaxID=3450742 RepID=UPI003F4438DC